MAECEHLARTSAYFDGELPDAEQADALAHIAECVECQGLLGAAVAFDAAASKPKSAEEPRPVVERRVRRRWPIAAIAAAAVAAAALILWYVRPKPSQPARVSIVLPAERAVAARFTGDAFMTHRPYAPLRAGDRAHEDIALGTLAALEQRNDTRNLVAALASSGDVTRAASVAAKLPDDAAAASDRAALSLATRDLESALVYAYRAVDRDAKLVPGWWNLALAARDVGLPRVAKDAFAHVLDAREPGWTEEAKTEIAALDRQIAAEDSSDAEKRGRAMLDGGAVLTTDDVQRFPALARFYFYDGLRVAVSKADVERLRPLAQALDQASGTTTAAAAIDRVAALDFAVRAKVAGKYRALVKREMNAADGMKLIEEARALGAPAADIFVGAAVFMGQSAKYQAELRAIAAPSHDPWFDLLFERDRIAAAYPNHDLRAEPELEKALAGCTNPAFQLRCGQLSQALGALLLATGRIEEAETRTKAAVDAFIHAHSPTHFRNARTFLAEIHRRRGRYALARAEFEEEIIAAKAAGACDLARYAEIGRANLAFMARDLERARAFLPAAKPPEGCLPGADVIGLIAAVDIARITNDPRDASAAREWVEHARASEVGAPATVAAARLLPPDANAIAALRDWLAASKPGYETDALRVLGYSTLISDAGARKAWNEVIDLAKAEYSMKNEPPCLVVTSVDDDRVTVAARVAGEVVGDTANVPAPAPASVPPAIVGKLASCTGIAVIARTQSHGRADLLPAAYPWWFAGDASHPATSTAAPRALQVIDVKPPDVGTLAPLPSLGASSAQFDVTLAGTEATPDRVLAALATATYAEIHAHGIVSAANEDAAFLALSPGIDGRFALEAGTIRKAKLTAAPFVVLGACRAASVASVFRERWSLPDALLVAGARGVVAADVPIPDASARAVLDELHQRLNAGEDPAIALAAIRKARGGWAAHLMLFR